MTDRKKVLFLITKGTWGGAQKYVFDLATHVPRNEFEAFVACGTMGKLTDDLLQETIRSVRVPALDRDISLLSDIACFFSIRRLLKKMRPDVIHLNSSKAAALGALAARFSGIPTIVFTAHGWPFKESRSALSTWIIYLISWFTALLSTHVVTVSESDAELGKRMWGVSSKIRFIPLGIGAPQMMPKEAAAQALSIDTTGITIVSSAELTANKGIRYAIEAVALLKRQGAQVKYYIIGDGEDREMLQKLANERGVHDRVSFLGFVPNAATYFSAFDIYLLPSIKEGMPYVLLEAAAAHLPIVCTTIVDPSFVRSYAHVRAVAPHDADALARALLDTMQAREEKPLFSEGNPFPLQPMVDTTIQLYR